MGTIVVEEYTTVGGQGAVGSAPVANLKTLLTTIVDATTSTSEESATLDTAARFITVYAAENHRVSLASTTGTVYAFIPAGQTRDYAVSEGSTLYYRLDA